MTEAKSHVKTTKKKMGLWERLKRKAAQTLHEPEPHVKHSYAQSGEDIIVKYIFEALSLERPTYIDIGAHHPSYLNNTALLYNAESRGINIEPDPHLFKRFKIERPEDINLNIGVSNVEGQADFYIMSAKTLNTFSKTEAENYEHEGDYIIEDIVQIDTKPIQNIIEEYADGVFPDFLSIDVEGLEESILRSIAYDKSSPTVICAETISFSEKGRGKKQTAVIEFLKAKDYLVYADTNINTIFVKRRLWER